MPKYVSLLFYLPYYILEIQTNINKMTLKQILSQSMKQEKAKLKKMLFDIVYAAVLT